MDKQAFRRQKFEEIYKEYFGSEPEGPIIDIQHMERDEYHVSFDRLELVWRKYAKARDVCRLLPIPHQQFDDPMKSDEYFLVEINQYTDGVRLSRAFLHYEFMNWMHILNLV